VRGARPQEKPAVRAVMEPTGRVPALTLSKKFVNSASVLTDISAPPQ
jgi:hypothetical protein